jgi:hypothetical protein
MAFRRNLFGSPPSLLANLPRVRSHNDIVAERERLALQEARLSRQIDDLRARQDDLSNSLHRPTSPTIPDYRPAPPPGRTPPAPLHKTEELSTVAFVNAGRKARNLPPLSERDLVAGPVQQPKVQATATMILRAGERARGIKPESEK